MAQENRRQEAVYMKAALLALVGALGILVAARFLTRKPAPPTPAQTAQAAKGKASAEQPPAQKPAVQKPTAQKAAEKVAAGRPATKAPAPVKGKLRKPKANPKAIAALLQNSDASAGDANDPFAGTGRAVRDASANPRNRRRHEDPPDRRSSRDRRAGREARDAVADQPDTGLQLVGIMRGGSATAVIRDLDDNRHYLHVGQQVEDYRVAKIGTDSVVLAQGAETVTLTMQTSHRGSSRDRRNERSRPRPRVRR